MIRASIVIVTYNCQDFIKDTLASVIKNSPESCEIIVLDNDSNDLTVKLLREFKEKINLIESSQNLGFSKGNNLAAKSAKGKFLFFLNPDIYMDDPILDELIDFLNDKDNVAIVGPKLVMINGTTQASVKRLPTISGAFREFVLGVKNAYSEYIPQSDQPLEVECVYGAAILIKKDFFENLGGFNEKYFLYYEDIDLCKRVKKLGKKIYYYPGVTLRHIIGGTKTNLDKQRLNYQASIIYHGLIGAWILRFIFNIYRLRRLFKLV